MRKYVLRYHETPTPIRTLTTKFGGQSVWLEEPSWPLSRAYATPMQFICQIALPAELAAAGGAQMAYLFATDDYDQGYRAYTFEPDGGENALIVQPGAPWPGPTQSLRQGPSLYRRLGHHGHWEQAPCEFDVELLAGSDPDDDTYERAAQELEASDAYWEALHEDKIGGAPVPTSNGESDVRRFRSDGWRLLLQLTTKDNEIGDPFFVNFAWDGIGYAFLSPDGTAGKFLWTR